MPFRVTKVLIWTSNPHYYSKYFRESSNTWITNTPVWMVSAQRLSGLKFCCFWCFFLWHLTAHRALLRSFPHRFMFDWRSSSNVHVRLLNLCLTSLSCFSDHQPITPELKWFKHPWLMSRWSIFYSLCSQCTFLFLSCLSHDLLNEQPCSNHAQGGKNINKLS